MEFIKWNFISVWHSAVAFFVPVSLFSINSLIYEDGKVKIEFYSKILF